MSHSNAYDKRTAARDGATFQIEWQYDDSPDLSYLGEYTDSRAAWQVDRKEGVLLGEYTENYLPFSDQEQMEKKIEELEEDGFDTYWDDEILEDESTLYTLHYWGYEILAADLRGTYERNSYRYFVPGNPYSDVEQSERVKYILQDYERMEDGNRGFWSTVGCVVTMYIEGEEVAYASLWGIESDCGDGYSKEVEEDLIDKCISDAKKNSAALAAKYRELADKLDNLDKPAE
jgi:hypothetical protein